MITLSFCWGNLDTKETDPIKKSSYEEANQSHEGFHRDIWSRLEEDAQRLAGEECRRKSHLAKKDCDELRQRHVFRSKISFRKLTSSRARLQQSFANAVKANSPTTMPSLENPDCDAMALKSGIATQPSTTVARPMQPISERSPGAEISASAPRSLPSRLPRKCLTWSGHLSFGPVPTDPPSPTTFPSARRTPKVPVCSTPPPRPRAPHLISDSPSPTKRDVKLIALRAERAKQLQQKQEATARARNVARALCNPAASWTRDKHRRRRIKAKNQAEKSVRLASCKLRALRQEELDLAQRLDRKRRRCGERWAICHDLD